MAAAAPHQLLPAAALQLINKVLTIDQSIYPEMCAGVHIVNSCPTVAAIWSAVQPSLTRRTTGKVRLVPKGEHIPQALADVCEASVLPKSMGGACAFKPAMKLWWARSCGVQLQQVQLPTAVQQEAEAAAAAQEAAAAAAAAASQHDTMLPGAPPPVRTSARPAPAQEGPAAAAPWRGAAGAEVLGPACVDASALANTVAALRQHISQQDLPAQPGGLRLRRTRTTSTGGARQTDDEEGPRQSSNEWLLQKAQEYQQKLNQLSGASKREMAAAAAKTPPAAAAPAVTLGPLRRQSSVSQQLQQPLLPAAPAGPKQAGPAAPTIMRQSSNGSLQMLVRQRTISRDSAAGEPSQAPRASIGGRQQQAARAAPGEGPAQDKELRGLFDMVHESRASVFSGHKAPQQPAAAPQQRTAPPGAAGPPRAPSPARAPSPGRIPRSPAASGGGSAAPAPGQAPSARARSASPPSRIPSPPSGPSPRGSSSGAADSFNANQQAGGPPVFSLGTAGAGRDRSRSRSRIPSPTQSEAGAGSVGGAGKAPDAEPGSARRSRIPSAGGQADASPAPLPVAPPPLQPPPQPPQPPLQLSSQQPGSPATSFFLGQQQEAQGSSRHLRSYPPPESPISMGQWPAPFTLGNSAEGLALLSQRAAAAAAPAGPAAQAGLPAAAGASPALSQLAALRACLQEVRRSLEEEAVAELPAASPIALQQEPAQSYTPVWQPFQARHQQPQQQQEYDEDDDLSFACFPAQRSSSQPMAQALLHTADDSPTTIRSTHSNISRSDTLRSAHSFGASRTPRSPLGLPGAGQPLSPFQQVQAASQPGQAQTQGGAGQAAARAPLQQQQQQQQQQQGQPQPGAPSIPIAVGTQRKSSGSSAQGHAPLSPLGTPLRSGHLELLESAVVQMELCTMEMTARPRKGLDSQQLKSQPATAASEEPQQAQHWQGYQPQAQVEQRWDGQQQEPASPHRQWQQQQEVQWQGHPHQTVGLQAQQQEPHSPSATPASPHQLQQEQQLWYSYGQQHQQLQEQPQQRQEYAEPGTPRSPQQRHQQLAQEPSSPLGQLYYQQQQQWQAHGLEAQQQTAELASPHEHNQPAAAPVVQEAAVAAVASATWPQGSQGPAALLSSDAPAAPAAYAAAEATPAAAPARPHQQLMPEDDPTAPLYSHHQEDEEGQQPAEGPWSPQARHTTTTVHMQAQPQADASPQQQLPAIATRPSRQTAATDGGVAAAAQRFWPLSAQPSLSSSPMYGLRARAHSADSAEQGADVSPTKIAEMLQHMSRSLAAIEQSMIEWKRAALVGHLLRLPSPAAPA